MYLFDLDGTLIDSNGIWADVDRTFLARRGMPYTKEYRDGMAHMIFPLAARFTKEYCGISDSCEDIMAEWMELARDSYSHVALKPCARELLQALREAGHRLAVFTSAVPAHCDAVLDVHGLRQYFDQIVYAHELGINKSSPEAFARAVTQLGEEPGNCILLDDSVRSCRAAKEAGLYVVGVYDKVFADVEQDMPSVCDRFIHSLSELLPVEKNPNPC
ncbi:MAG: HAD-IA family hydrolase [Oscillospiraceae bacterium]|nr:HAD-IA family hydrolase [Oscillospiraceae bacterium]